MADLWNAEIEIRNLPNGPEVPEWIDQDIAPSTVAAIVQGGCASGAYMPAVTYHVALETMAEHGDEVLEYLSDAGGLVFPTDVGWAGLATHLLSAAVESWACGVEDEISDALDELEMPTHESGYPLMYVDHEGNMLCAGCATDDLLAGDADPDALKGSVYWEGPARACDGCGDILISAYGDPEAGDD